MTLKISSATIKFEGEWVRFSHSGGRMEPGLIIPLFPLRPDWRDVNPPTSNPSGCAGISVCFKMLLAPCIIFQVDI